MQLSPPIRHGRPSEAGYMLISVIILLAIFLIAMAVGVPKVAESIQRDRELETMHRGKQYIRAIQLYFRKFHRYPPNIDALVKTNEIRFLRKRYVDPITGKDDWKPIIYCQNKTPLAMGFFGQPLAGTGCGGLAGIGPSGGNGIGGANLLSASATAAGSGLLPVSAAGTGSTAAGASSSGSDTPVDANGTPINNTGSPLGNGQTFGGGGIIGFSPPSPKQSILIYKKKNHYNEWEFLYSQLMDQQIIAGGNSGNIGQPANGAPGFNQPTNLTTPTSGSGTQPTQPTDNSGSTPILTPPADPPSTPPQQ